MHPKTNRYKKKPKIMTTWIIIAIYWAVAVAAVYAIRAYNNKKNRLKIAVFETFEMVKRPSLWKQIGTHASILFLVPPLMPVIIPVFLIDKYKKQKHNKTMKMSKKMKKEEEPQDEKKYSAKMEENLPNDIYTQASKTMMDALIFGTFDDFENMLDDAVDTILYRSRTIRGKAEVLAYWWGWRKRYVLTKDVTHLEVVLSRYYSHACLKVENNQLVMFQIKEGKVARILSGPMRLTSLYSDDNMLNYPLEYERIKRFLAPLVEAVDKDGKPMLLTDRIPCLHCGVESQDLTWYTIRRPDWFYKNWKFGLVSVCPQCGRVVEYKEVKTEESDDEKNLSIEGSTYSDKGNAFSEYAEKMYSEDCASFLENALDDEVVPELREVVRKAFADNLIPQPSEIKVEEGYRFEITLPSNEGSGDITHIRIVDEEGNATETLTEHLVVNATEMGAWQLYLLENYYTVLPTVWHGGYNRREFIFRESDIDDIIPLKFHDLSELQAQDKLMPCVTVGNDEAEGHSLVVHCCYWNQWEGLVRQCVEYNIENGRVVSKNGSKEVLYQYHCGMWF